MRKEQSILYISSPKSPRCGRIGKEIDAAPLLILLSQLARPSLHVQLTHSICQDSCLHLFLNVCLAYSWQRGAIFRSTYCKVATETLLSPRDGASQATSSTTYLTVLGKSALGSTHTSMPSLRPSSSTVRGPAGSDEVSMPKRVERPIRATFVAMCDVSTRRQAHSKTRAKRAAEGHPRH